ncbi:SDR family NAD(P)-dependent oxidoreductase [Nocardia brasiliensis]|uniref:SDR family NAD(P)-dependent oxidoreductase n=1 Tax=Nocardia brasiliensis TaxID=37326 RepID=UPI002453F78D|nr:SDR family NAD(P)-dependent oxidoreductase [Nocardia brasiliensis]
MVNSLIIGGGRPGIGQATVSKYISEGRSVTATIDVEYLEEAKNFMTENSQVDWIEIDHADTDAVIDSLSAIDSIDQAVVAEFYFYMENANQFDVQKWNRSLAVNLTLPKLVGHYANNLWSTCRSVVYVTSTEAGTGSFGAHAYAATKAATHNLVKSLTNSSGGRCRHNALAAGWIGGVMDTDEVFNMSRSVTPLGRLGDPAEIADMAYMLNSEAATFVAGATIVADGGYTGVDTISKYEYSEEFKE